MKVESGRGVPYSQRRKDAVVKSLPQLALSTVDSYVAAATAFPGLGFGPAEASSTPFRVLSGALAVTHAINGYARTQIETHSLVEKRSQQAQCVGEFITAAGFAGLTLGLGPWAVPLVGLGTLTTNIARFS